jgi:hypothetical protein
VKTTAVHVVMSCTNRKRAGATAYPRLREVVADDVEQRAAAWIARVADAQPTVTARDLYAGEYWRAGLDLAAKAGRDFSTSTWVLSAGLGLIKVDDAVPAYGATLASGHEDSVVTGTDQRSGREVRRRWWSALASWQGPVGPGRPRRISDLAAHGSTIIICAGPDYLSAIAPELLDALNVLGGERLLVFGSGLPESGLEPAWVRVPGQLRLRFGGSMSSTGVRAASAIIHDAAKSGELGGDHARQLVASWSAATLPLPRFERKRLSDRDIELWIRSDLKAHPGSVSKSISLRRFRDDGFACEQSRFGRLHDQISGAHP